MQHNTPQKNKSHILRTTEEAKRKSRHKLMGSIFLLLIALVILLNVTSKVKPIPVNPKIIEIQDTDTAKAIIKKPASGVIHQTISSEPLALKNSTSEVITTTQAKIQASQIIAPSNTDTTNNGPKIAVISKNPSDNNKPQETNTNKNNNTNTSASIGKLSFTPRVVTEAIKSKPTPEQILNGDIPTNLSTKYYVQLVASSNKDKINQLQQELNIKGIKTFTQEIKTANGTSIYRLRMGPFNNKDEANQKMSSINN